MNIDRQKIDELKKAGFRVFSAKIAGIETVYRSLSRREFREIQKKLADKTEAMRKANPEVSDAQIAQMKEEGEEQLVLKSVLSPQLDSELDLLNLPAGYIQSIAESVMSVSGFGETIEPVEL